MTAATLIARARELGVRLFVADGRIKAEPMGRLPAALKDAIRDAKADVIALLNAEAGLCSDCGAPLGTDGRAVRFALVAGDGTVACGDCLTGRSALRRSGAAV